MTKIVMISGSRSIKDISAGLPSIDRIMELKFSIIVGDAVGVDKLVQEYLRRCRYATRKLRITSTLKFTFHYGMVTENRETLLTMKRWELQEAMSIETR